MLAAERFIVQRNGGAEGDRTLDLLIANQTLSQLSYSPSIQGSGAGARRSVNPRSQTPGP